jgi:hypothetical protein
MGLMRRAVAREEQERRTAMEEQKQMTDRFASTLVIARVDHCSGEAGKGSGHQQTVA